MKLSSLLFRLMPKEYSFAEFLCPFAVLVTAVQHGMLTMRARYPKTSGDLCALS